MFQDVFNQILQQLKNIAEGVNNPWAVWVSLLGIFVALLLGIVGIFQDWIRARFRRPKLNLSIKVAPPDCHKTSFYRSDVDRKVCDTYYLRFRVDNYGNQYAENIEVMITEVYQEKSGRYEKLDNFLPLNLAWSYYRTPTMEKIQPKLFKHLDFGHISKAIPEYLTRFGIQATTNIIFEFDVVVMPNTGSHILLPGKYMVRLIIAANNHKPLEKTYYVILRDAWANDESDMLQKNISITEKSEK